jgi:hypothetical protein
VWHRALAGVVGGVVVTAAVVGVGPTVAGGSVVVLAMTAEVDVVGAARGLDPLLHPLATTSPAAKTATKLRFTGINPQPYTTTHAKMGINASCE